jgi:RNA polymerase sigma-70 factor (ECF subfamily)
MRVERDGGRAGRGTDRFNVNGTLMSSTDSTIATWFVDHRAFLWGLSYRITGSADDADDVVQDTFVRACKHAPTHVDNPRQWLMRIAINLGRDVLRRRKRRGYVGPWLPTPIDSGEDDSPPSFEPVVDGQTLEARYDLVESVSLAFLQALEALTATQRAVLLLRDVFDYTAAEVAADIDTSEGNVRIIHLRARRAMEAYERHRTTPTPAVRARTHDVLRRFVALLTTGDVHAI